MKAKGLPAPVAAVVAVVGVLLAPVLLPFALLQTKRERRRQRAVAEAMPCLGCGEVLGERSLERAEALWRARVAQMRAEHPYVIFRLVRPWDAVCVACGRAYRWREAGAVFEAIEVLSAGKAAGD